MKSQMPELAANELIVIRHAPADTQGRLCGRRDVPALVPDAAALASLAEALRDVAQIVASPALRCRQTAQVLWPRRAPELEARLWEQDFGAQEGMAHADLPDLGALSLTELARHVPPEGESFADMVARAQPALRGLARQARTAGPVAVVAHAGTARAALALALGDVSAALAFEIAPLSLTRLRCLPEGAFSVVQVNGQV